VDKYKGLLEDNVKKIGLRLGQTKLSELQERQIKATKVTQAPPISAFAQEEFVYDTSYKPLKSLLPDFKQTPLLADGTRSLQNFNRHTRPGITIQKPVSTKVFI
jgi:hypothetical protein